MTKYSHRARRHQAGSTLIVAMVFLLLFAMIVASSYRSSLTSVRAIGNMQWRTESINATNDAINQLLSNFQTFSNPAVITAAVLATPFTFDANGDAVPDITVTFPVVTLDGHARAGPRCIKVEPLRWIDLDPGNSEDLGCFGNNAASNTGLGLTNAAGTVTSIAQTPSLCANTEWSITVQAVDAVTNTSASVVQGVGVRVPTTSVASCN